MAMKDDPVLLRNAQAYDAHAQSWQAAMSTNVGHKYLEKPAMERELPDTLLKKKVLCIGVGSGDELQEILKLGPECVVGIDTSSELLKITKARFPSVAVHQMDMTQMRFADSSFDFIYSSLTLHYEKDWIALLAEIHRVMKEGGELLFSTHHPEYWSRKPKTGNSFTDQKGNLITEHTALLPGDVEITYYNHENANVIRGIVELAGFQIQKCLTPGVIEVAVERQEEAESYQNLKAKNEQSPLFFIVKAVKAKSPDLDGSMGRRPIEPRLKNNS